MKTPKPPLSIALVLIMAIAHLANAQQGNVSAGGSISGTSGSMSYSVGQTDYMLYTSETGSISFGLQQPWFEILGVPTFLDVPGISIGSGESLCFNAINTVILGGSGKVFIVEEGGHADVIAGERILIKHGTRVEAGGSLHARISTEWCFPDDEQHLYPPAIVYEDATPNETPPTLPANEALYDPLDANSRFAFKVYPNPGHGIYTVELITNDNTMPVSISIHSMMGEVIATVDNVFCSQITIDIMDATPGIYLLRVLYNNRFGTEKIIKQ